MRVLIVEDDLNKLGSLTSYLSERFPQAEITGKRSYQSGLKAALSLRPTLVVLDMTMPTYDVSVGESGGRPRPFGGREILSELARKGAGTKVIVVTQFETFGEGDQRKSLPELDRELREAFGDFYVGAVYYHPAQTDWKENLLQLVQLADAARAI